MNRKKPYTAFPHWNSGFRTSQISVVPAIYIGPLFESTTHGYDTKDYKQVDRRLGDNADFAAYVKKAHELGIKVVVDGVFNHTGREFFAFRDIQEKREQSPYCGWYKGIWFGGNTCYNDGFSYEAWRNCFELVNLNLQNQQVRDYLLDVIDFWIDEFDINGIRLDCADCWISASWSRCAHAHPPKNRTSG